MQQSEYKRMMVQATRLRNQLEKILKRLSYRYGSTQPISFDVDKLIKHITEKGFPENRIDKQLGEKGYICTIDTRSGIQITIRHDRNWKVHVYLIIDTRDFQISFYSEETIADIIMAIDALGEKYRMKHEKIHAYLKEFRQTPIEKIVSICHAFEVTDDIQFRINAADRIIHEAFVPINGIAIKERIYPYCDHIWAKDNVRYDVSYDHWEFTIIFHPIGKRDTHFRFDSKVEYINHELNERNAIFFNQTPEEITAFLMDLFTDIKLKVEKYDKEKIESLLERYHRPIQLAQYPNAPLLPSSLKRSRVLRLPVFNVILVRTEQTEFSYEVHGENNTLYVPESIEYQSSETKNIIYSYLDKIFKEVARIYFPLRVAHLSQKTGLKYSNCSFIESNSVWGMYKRSSGIVILNYCLITASQEDIDSVIIHELCHSLASNHGLKFQKALLKYAGRELYDLNFKNSPLKKLL